MAGFILRKNMVFNWDGTEYRIERVQPNGELLIERIEDGHLAIVSRETILDEYALGKISAKVTEALLTKSLVPLFTRPLDELSEQVQSEAKRRKHYLHSILAQGNPVFTANYLKPLIARAAKEMGDPNPPGVTSVYRWYRCYRESDDPRAIVPRIDLRGPKQVRQSDRILQLVSEAVEEAFKVSPQATCGDIHTRLIGKVKIENQRSLGARPIKTPSLRTIYRLMERAEAYEITVLKEGKAAADRRYRINKTGVKTSRILAIFAHPLEKVKISNS